MAILDEAAQLAKQKLGDIFHDLTIERSVVGLFFTGVKLSNGAGGVCFTLESAKSDAEIAVMGPTASMLPEPMFERGVRVVGGVWVKKPDELMDVLASGASGYHFLDRLADRMVLEKS